MARLRRDQGQVHPDGEPQVDRDGIFLSIDGYLWKIIDTNVFLTLFFNSANGTVQDCRTGDENQSLQQGGSSPMQIK